MSKSQTHDNAKVDVVRIEVFFVVVGDLVLKTRYTVECNVDDIARVVAR
jgi:hypothetical protein